MVNSDKKTGVVIFSDATGPIISEILQKYQLEETDDETFKKLESGELLQGEIILNIVEEIILGKISQKDLPSLLGTRLNIKKETGENLARDIEAKLLVIAKKIPREEAEKMEREAEIIVPEEIPAEKPLVAPRPIAPKKEEEEILQPSWKKSPRIGKYEKTIEEPEIPKKPNLEKKPVEKIKKIPEKPDVYREPIE